MKNTVEDVPVEIPEDAEHRSMLERVKAREKIFEDGWWKAAETAVNLFNCEKEDPQNPYNILYSNTEVLKPSLYSATPKPDVRGRFVENPVSPLTKMVERFLVIFSDPANPGEESFDTALSESVTSALVSGLGFIRLRSYPENAFPLCIESGHYKGLIWPAGRKWTKLPWIAFRHELTRQELFAQFQISKEEQPNLKFSDEGSDADKDSSDKKSATIVYEVWNKATREIHYLCEDWEGILIKEEEDTLKLQGFYPTPGLLMMTKKPGRMIPTPLYQYYRHQAEELNRVSYRLNKVLSAIRVRGAYNTLLGEELKQILADENTENALVPAQQAGLMMQSGGFDKNIWLLPIEKLVEVATQLYNARAQIKQVIYEITGLSDIIRGSSVASETATAQNLKNKWGSIRLRDMQRSVAGYVRDLYRLATDAAVEVLPAEQWKLVTQAPLPLQAEKEAAIAQLQYSQMSMPGQPPDPKLIQAAQSPSIEELLAQIKSDANRAFTINVQADSTVDLDTATDKQEVTEFMGSMAQLVPALGGFTALGPSGMAAAQSILVAVCSRYKFGLAVVDAIRAIQPPPPAPQGPTPEQEKLQKELDSRQAEVDQKEKGLQDLLSQLEDAKRGIEVAQKELQAELRVANAEQSAQSAQQDAKTAQTEAKLKTIASKLAAPSRGSAPSSGKGSPQAAPAQDNASAAAIQTMAQAVTEMQKALTLLASPRIAKKDEQTGVWSSVLAPSGPMQ
jgi:Skp family chaperone for outer membrane proteins